jgi:uncharacterized protein
MPVTPTYPGVYIEELPSGVHTITGVATSITAFVGFTPTGPVNKAVRISNFGGFERTFGGLYRESEISYAVQQFFLNGGSDAYVVRVARNATAASVDLAYSAGNSALVVSAANEGAWGNNVRLDLDYATTNPDSTFNLRVTRYEAQNGALVVGDVEQYRNLSMNSRSAFYAPNVVNAASKTVRLSRPGGIAFDPNQRGWSRSGTLATFPALTANDVVVAGFLDGRDQFSLSLTSPATITDIPGLVNALTAAIAAAGLTSRLAATQVDAAGVAGTGNYVQLTSQSAAPTNVASEFSAVEIAPAAANDAAPKLKLGVANGGREKDGSSFRRPIQTGTTGDSLAGVDPTTAVTGTYTVTLEDRSTATTRTLATGNFTFGAGTTIANVAAAVEGHLQSINDRAAAGARVSRVGNVVRAVAGGDNPNVAIVFADGAGGGAANAKLIGGAALVERREYPLGPTASLGSPVGIRAGTAGNNGIPPGAAEIMGSFGSKTGIYALRDVDLFNLLVIPATSGLSEAQANSVLSAALSFCEGRRAFMLVDPFRTKDQTSIAGWAASLDSKNGAVFYPQIEASDPLEDFRIRSMPPSGALAGVFARTDAARGVWKAPAGIEAGIRGAQGLTETLTDEENGPLNQSGINALRTFPVYGTVVWGARTLEGADQKGSEWKYIPIRRLALMLEESLYRGTKWVVFEPNDEPLWAQIRLNVGAFMHNLFRQGAFQGKSSREAYFVKCDAETTTQNDRDLGRVNILVGFAPLKPAEFVVIQIQQIAGQIET